jgi:hypothetical protein
MCTGIFSPKVYQYSKHIEPDKRTLAIDVFEYCFMKMGKELGVLK